MLLSTLTGLIEDAAPVSAFGTVAAVRGLIIAIAGPVSCMPLGAVVDIIADKGTVRCEVVGFDDNRAIAMPLGRLDGVHQGARVRIGPPRNFIRPSGGWLGRIIDANGEAIDGRQTLPAGQERVALDADAPLAGARRRLGPPLDLGIRALNTFLPLRRGQRIGLFAGSGVGKSVLMAMIARNAQADVFVIALVGERGRELNEFIEDDLGTKGLARSVVVVATSDEPALQRRRAAYLAMAVAEYFRDQGQNVVLIMDSVTRFAMAQREIGLALGEPPTTRGYTPTVFASLPRLLERAGPGAGNGNITAIFTVLVDGDDHDEPVADAARGILDGHVVLERAIAERGRFPAINILKSVSRSMPGACDPQYIKDVLAARRLMSRYADMEELIRLGAYRQGSDAEIDQAIALNPEFETFLAQSKEESTSLSESYRRLADIVNRPRGTGPGLVLGV